MKNEKQEASGVFWVVQVLIIVIVYSNRVISQLPPFSGVHRKKGLFSLKNSEKWGVQKRLREKG